MHGVNVCLRCTVDRTPEDSPVGTPIGTPVAGNSFRGFTYVAPSFLASPNSSPVKPGIL
jgi:hypothetical protein